MAIRSFLAFELSKEMRETVSRVSEELRYSWSGIRWVKPEHIHLTVVFMGSVKEQDLPGIGQQTGEICGRYRPFEIRIRGVGVFPGKQNPRVIWVGLQGDLERMAGFRDALSRKLEAFGVKRETRRFTPHLTLGRFKKGFSGRGLAEEFLSRYHGLRSSIQTLRELVLFRSDLRPEGAVYTALGAWPLSGGRVKPKRGRTMVVE